MRHKRVRASKIWRLMPVLAILIVIALAAGPSLVQTSQAEGAPFNPLPNYGPLEGCVDVAVASTGMYGGSGTINVNVPGPVLDAWLVWTGTNDVTPADPQVSELTVNGSSLIGNSYDELLPISIRVEWYSYLANVGPNGANLVSQGANTLAMSGWGELAPTVPTNRNGATLFVAYDTTPCTRANALYVLDSIDWAFWRDPRLEFATGVIPFQFPAAGSDRTGHLYTSIAGIDHMQETNLQCRGIRMWYEAGSGAVPAALYQQAWPESVGINGGFAIADDLWNPIPPCTPDFRAPATAVEGGYNGGDYGQATLTVNVPAGTSHVAFQLESERPADVNITPLFGGGESFAWIGPGSPFIIDIPSPDMTVSKDDGVTTANPGDLLTYTIDFANLGDGDADNVTITDTLPDYVSFVSASDGGSEAGGVVTWNLGTVPAGASGSVTLTVQVDAVFPSAGTFTLENLVSISTTTPGDDPSNNDDDDVDTVEARPTIDVTKAAAPDPVPAGDQITYTIHWSVGGTAPAVNLTITDAVPDKTSFVSASDGGTEAGGVVTWLLGDQVPGANGSVTMIVVTDSPLENGLEIPNTVFLNEFGPYTLEDTDDAPVNVVSDHTLVIEKTAEPALAVKGGEITYTLTWGVLGNETAPNLTLTDELPFGTEFVSASDSGVYTPPNVVWNFGDVNPPASGTVTFVVKVNPLLPNDIDIENTAILGDDDPGTPDVEDSVVTPVEPTPYGSIGDDVFIDENDNGVRDPGEAGIPGITVILSDPGPDGVCGTADDVELDTTITDADGKYLFPDLFPGDYCVTVDETNIPAVFTLGGSFTNPLAVTVGPNEDVRDADFGYVPIVGTATIGDYVWLDANRDGVQDPGEIGIPNVTVVLKEPGPDGVCGTADDVTVASTTTDAAGMYKFIVDPGVYCVMVDETTLPGGLDLTAGPNPHGPITVTYGDVYLDADFGYGLPDGKAILGDYVWLDADRDGVQDPGENGIANVTVVLKDPGPDGLCGTADDVMVASTTTDANGMYEFLVDAGSYCVMVDETTLPDGLELTAGPNPHGPVTLAAGDVYLDADFGYAQIDFTLSITKSDSVASVRAGEELVYTIEWAVTGTSVAKNTLITDAIPVGTSFVSASNGGTESGGAVTWNLGNVVPPANGTVTLTVLVDANLTTGTVIHNTVVITADDGDPDEDDEDTPVVGIPVLAIRKSANTAGPVHKDDVYTYQVCYQNVGGGDALNTMLIDTLPTNVAYVADSASPAAVYNNVAHTLTWDIGTLGFGGAEICVTFDVKVTGTTLLTQGVQPYRAWADETIYNTATIDASNADPKTADHELRLVPVVNPQIFKSVNTSSVAPGEEIEFTLAVTNNGDTEATNVVVTDELSSFLEDVRVSTTQGTASYNAATNTVTVDIGTVAPGDSVVITILAKVINNDTVCETAPFTFTNAAVLGFSEGNPRESNIVQVAVTECPPPPEIPEPGTILLLGSGLAGLAGWARRRRQEQA